MTPDSHSLNLVSLCLHVSRCLWFFLKGRGGSVRPDQKDLPSAPPLLNSGRLENKSAALAYWRGKVNAELRA